MNTLEKNEIQTDDMGKKDNSVIEFDIIKFALKTLFLVVVIGVLLFSTFFSVFPYQGMKFFTDLNLKKRALDSADTYIDRHLSDYPLGYAPAADSKFADALVCAVNNSADLMDNAINKDGYGSEEAVYFAQYVSKHTNIYLQYNQLDSMYSRSAMIDTYNKKYSLPIKHPTLYSFTDYVRLKGVRANFVLGKKDDIMAKIGATTSTWDADGWSIPADSLNYHEAFMVFAQLNEYLRMELNRINFFQVPINYEGGALKEDVINKNIKITEKSTFSYFLNKNGELTYFYDKILKRFPDFLQDIKSYADIIDSEQLLPYVYYLKILFEFNCNMRYMGLALDVNSNYYESLFGDKLRKISENWLSISWVKDIVIYEKDGTPRKTSDYMSLWYLSGMRTSYVMLYSQGK